MCFLGHYCFLITFPEHFPLKRQKFNQDFLDFISCLIIIKTTIS